MEYAELIVKVNETGPGEGVTLDGLAHGIGGLEFVSKAEHVQTTIAVLVVDGMMSQASRMQGEHHEAQQMTSVNLSL